MNETSTNSAAVPPLTHVREPVSLAGYDVPHPKPFVCSIRITDDLLSRAIPHVSNIEYVRWLDRAAELHSDSLGYTREAMLHENIMWFVARHEIDYLGEAWGEDELLIATWVSSFARVKSWRAYAIIRPADEAVLCRAATLWVLVDLESRRPRRIPPEMAAAFDALEASAASREGR